ncbi:hypothetical protein TA3x_003828 [Tundrisphaera sp. TA3]|uniref:hypothetical protein n=1 Tax=Tundrisphaera sp. TA3 TaxID=3435775 RepID=UPI003EBCF29E
MPPPYLVRGRLYAPFYIFLRTRMADADLLATFGIGDYTDSADARGSHYAVVADDGEWTMLADDWGYTLWYRPTTWATIAELGRTIDVFAGSVGEDDRSYDFAYYRGGRLARKYAVSDLRGLVVEVDVGDPLPAEAARFDDELDHVLALAASLGIRSQYEEHEIRVYRSAEPGRRIVLG